MVNRLDDSGKKFFDPGRNSRVCSAHFKDGKPTTENPLPTLSLGYENSERRASLFTPPSSAIGRKRKTLSDDGSSSTKASLVSSDTSSSLSSSKPSTSVIKITYPNPKDAETPIVYQQPPTPKSTSQLESNVEFKVTKKPTPNVIKNINKTIKSKVHKLKMNEAIKTVNAVNDATPKPLSETLLKNNHKCLFYTNIPSLQLFHDFHDIVKGFIRNRFSHKTKTNSKLINKLHTPKKPGRTRKLPSADELLLTLMKLRLALLFEDLADRFRISKSCASKIFQSWIRALSRCLSSLIFFPEEEKIRNTTPPRFRGFNRLNGIIDCIYIQRFLSKLPRV